MSGEEFIYFWQYNLLGSFSTNLANTIACADTKNLEKLRKGFPEEVEAMQNFHHKKGWWEEVEKKFKG